MSESNNSPDMNKALFVNLVMMFSATAMQQLGKLVNPMTGKTEVNLEGAQIYIDLLLMLQAKTRNNLDAEEARMLNEVISSLQVNFVEVAQNAPPAPEPAAPAESSPAPDAPPAPAAKKDEKEPKFRKSYGE